MRLKAIIVMAALVGLNVHVAAQESFYPGIPGELSGTITDYNAANDTVAIDGKRYRLTPQTAAVLSSAPKGVGGLRGLEVGYSITELPDGTWIVNQLGVLEPD